MQSFQQNRHIIFLALITLKLLVSLISRLVACSARIVGDRQTDRQTDTQDNYYNPRCACAPRVNYPLIQIQTQSNTSAYYVIRIFIFHLDNISSNTVHMFRHLLMS